jgi:hypothetical protein
LMTFPLLPVHKSLWPFLSTIISLLRPHKLSVLNLLLPRCCFSTGNRWDNRWEAKTDDVKKTVKHCLKNQDIGIHERGKKTSCSMRMRSLQGLCEKIVWVVKWLWWRHVWNLMVVLVSVWQINGYHIFLHNHPDLQCSWFSDPQVSWFHQSNMLWM